MNTVLPYLKAVVAFIVPGAVVLGSAVTEASDGGSSITTAEWVTAIVACIVTSGAVYQAENRDPLARHQDESVMPPEAGVTDLALVVAVAALIVALLVLFGVRA